MKKMLTTSLAFLILLTGCGGPGDKYNELAQCLTEEGAVMFGSFICNHCKDQKEMFGDAMENIEYVECHENGPNPDLDRCLENKIEYLPTWIMADGEKVLGAKTPEELAQIAGCPVPVPEEES